MKIEMRPVVQSWSIEREFGIRVLDCQFTQMVENDSYVPLWLDDDRVNELWTEITSCNDGSKVKYVNRCTKELELINKFRAMGYTDNILVFVSW